MAIDSPADGSAAGDLRSALRTFLTADVRGYTRFTQEFGDEAAARLATKFAAVSREVCSAHGGEVIELRGDEALAVFSSARQALRASIELQKRFAAETQVDAQLPLRVGIGLDAGEVVPFEEGFRGGALNLAQRLSSLAAAGEVLASDGVVHLARRIKGLAYSERGLVELKGFADPVRVIRVLDEKDPAVESLPALGAAANGNGANGHDGESDDNLPIGGFLGALPEGLLVARDDEFDQILVAIQAVERRSGRLVLLSGEPGVGKTRLAQEVTLKARNHSFVMATGRCYEPEATVPFYPFLEALATLHAVAPEYVRQALPERWADVQRLLPNQGSPQAAAIWEGQEEQQRLFWGVTGFIQAIAAERPVALLLDDLHWADGSSLELLQHLARHTRAHRVLLLGTYRDVEVNRQHPLESALTDLGRERLVNNIEIRRLDERGTRLLIAATLGGSDVAPDFVRLVHRQTEGNPFFVEEVVRTLVDRGDVFQKDGRWEGCSLEEIEVPKSVRSVVGQRLSRLRPETQEVLREASVLGPAFTFPDLHHMCERTEPEIEAALEESLAAGLVRETAPDTYAFNHALTQGTLYAELTSRKRRRLHHGAARALQQLPEAAKNQRIAELAWHFLEADDPEPAFEFARRAGKAARDLFAYDEAERHFRTALELARELRDQTGEVRMLESLAGTLRTVARYDEALELLEAAIALHRLNGDATGERWATANLGRVHALRGTPAEGISRIVGLLEAIEATGTNEPVADGTANAATSKAGMAALYTALANLYQTVDQSSAQLEAAEKALELAREDSAAGAKIQAEGQMWRATALAELGELNDARHMLEDVIPLARANRDALVLSRTLNSLATIYSEAGHYEKERDYMEQALAAAEEMGEPARVAFMTHRLGWHLLVRGEWKDARTQFLRAAQMFRPLGWPSTGPWTVLALAFLALVTGEFETGESYLAEGTRLAIRPGWEGHFLILSHWVKLDRFLREGRSADAIEYLDSIGSWPDDWTYPFILPYRAWAELERGNLDLAQDFATEATERASAENNRTILVDALRVQGMVSSYEGRYEDAEQAFEESIAIARTIEQPYPLARGLEGYARTLLDQGKREAGLDQLNQSLQLFDRLGATIDASRVRLLLEDVASAGAPAEHALAQPVG